MSSFIAVYWLLFCCGLGSILTHEIQDLEVEIEQGVLRGKESKTENGKVFYSFSGIPYATPPLGNLRFKEPQPPAKWTNIRDATVEGNTCRSRHMVSLEFIGNEDCLYLNVYTPSVPKKSSEENITYPVMFWIHGGSFYMGGGTSLRYGPDWFMDNDVILVTINYRLGPMGFLNLHIEEAPGNAGLKDQVAALKWVRENIAAFGGDPQNLTIFGESAGGASVHYMLLTDVTKGLFQKAIVQSGVAIDPWAFENDPRTRAFELCRQLNYTISDKDDAKKALRLLMNSSAEDIMEASEKVPPPENLRRFNDIAFAPSVETTGKTPFLTKHPMDILNTGTFQKLPLMVGYTDGEGTMALKSFIAFPQLYEEVENDFERFVPEDLNMDEKLASRKIKEFYFGNKSVSAETHDAIADLYGDYMLITRINQMAKIHANRSKRALYFYRFSFDELSYYKILYGIPEVPRACHADELLYLFTNRILEFPNPPGSDVDKTQKRMIKMWTNFAKTGNPTPEISDLLPVKWEPMSADKRNYLSIGKDLQLDVDPDKERLEFWEELYRSGSVSIFNKGNLLFTIGLNFSMKYF